MGQSVSSRHVNLYHPFLQNILQIAIGCLFLILTLRSIVSLRNQTAQLYALTLFIKTSGNCLWCVESHISVTIMGQEFMILGILLRFTLLFKWAVVEWIFILACHYCPPALAIIRWRQQSNMSG